MSSPDNYDSDDTEPIPLFRPAEYVLQNQNHVRRPSRRVLTGLIVGCVALGITPGVAAIVSPSATPAEEVLKTDTVEQDLLVTALANDIVSGLDLEVDCDTSATLKASEGEGYALAYVKKIVVDGETYVPPIITMQGELCTNLLDLPHMEDAEVDKNSTLPYERAERFATAVGLLLHEVEHINLVFDEAEATCYAVQKLPKAIEAYYPSPEIAFSYSQIAALALSQQLMPEYTSPECEPGGAYDLGISAVYTTDKLVSTTH